MDDIVKILVVDDEQEICDLTRNFLRKKNYCTLGATSKKEAIEIVKNDKPQIVLLDIRLGSESGLETLRQIKEINKDIKVIMVTALNDEDSVAEAKSLGADDYIAKPFTANFLEDIILKKVTSLKLGEKDKR
jgi:two-component system response regulator (stage 0 sporulation protein F)